MSIKPFSWYDLQGPPAPGAAADLTTAGNHNTAVVIPASSSPPTAAQIAAAGNSPVPVYQPGKYGNAQIIPVAFAAAGNLLVLVRPVRAQRVLLVIVNDFAGAVIRVNWDNPATANVGVSIPAAGNLFLDNFVPQNDVHVFAPQAGGITIFYANLDVMNPTPIMQNSQS